MASRAAELSTGTEAEPDPVAGLAVGLSYASGITSTGPGHERKTRWISQLEWVMTPVAIAATHSVMGAFSRVPSM